MNHAERLYANSVVKGPHSLRDGRNVYYITTPTASDIYLRKDGTVGPGTKAENALLETRGFWDSSSEAQIALDIWKIQYYNKLHRIEEPKPKSVKDTKRYTKKEFLKIIHIYV